jgi:RND family efflux transporter MFP subunit
MNQIIKSATILIMSTTIAIGCKEKKISKDQQLEILRKEKSALQDKISKLENEIGTKDSARQVAVVTESVTPIDFRTYIDLQGRVDAAQTVLATSEAPGIVTQINVRNGQYVSRGQVLAILKSDNLIDDDIDKGIAELDQQIDFAKTMYDKQKRLWEQEIGTEVQLLAAKNNYESLVKRKQTIGVGKKRVAIAKKSYSIIAPISGMVDNLELTIGQMVAPGMVGIKLVNTGNLKVKADVPENYGSVVNQGDDVMLVFSDIQDTVLSRISYVSPSINPMSRAFTSEITLPSSSKYKPNMNAQVRIVGYHNPRAFVVPASIIQKTDDGDFVYIDDGGKAAMRKVNLGKSYNGKIEVLAGLNLSDRIITNGYQDLNEGDQLKF